MGTVGARDRRLLSQPGERGVDVDLDRFFDRVQFDVGMARVGCERSIAWLGGYRRLTIRYERHSHLFTGFLTLAAALTCFKHLAKITT